MNTQQFRHFQEPTMEGYMTSWTVQKKVPLVLTHSLWTQKLLGPTATVVQKRSCPRCCPCCQWCKWHNLTQASSLTPSDLVNLVNRPGWLLRCSSASSSNKSALSCKECNDERSISSSWWNDKSHSCKALFSCFLNAHNKQCLLSRSHS